MKSPSPHFKESSGFISQLAPLFFLTTIFFLNFISRIIMAPLLPAIERDLGISHTDAGSLFLLISVGYFSTLVLAGFVSARLMHRKTVVLSAASVGLALLLTSMGHNLWSIQAGLLLLGMAAGLYLPSGIATLTSLVDAKNWGKAIAIHELAPNLSFVAAPLIAEGFLLWVSWRYVLIVLGIVSILLGLAFAFFSRGGSFRGEPPSLSSFRPLFSEPAFWMMIVLFSLGISGTLGIYTMLPLYLVSEHGINRNLANTLIAFSRISGLGMAFLAGWASDRLGPKRTMMGVFFLTGIVTILLGCVHGTLIMVIVFLQPLMAACFFPPGFTALSSIGPASTRNVAVSLIIPFAFIIGGGLIPTVIGMAGNAGSFASGITSVGGIIAGGSILSIYLKLPHERRSRD